MQEKHVKLVEQLGDEYISANLFSFNHLEKKLIGLLIFLKSQYFDFFNENTVSSEIL